MPKVLCELGQLIVGQPEEVAMEELRISPTWYNVPIHQRAKVGVIFARKLRVGIAGHPPSMPNPAANSRTHRQNGA